MKLKKYFSEKTRNFFLVLMLLFCGLFANTVMSQTNITWTGATNNDWATASNWSPEVVPGSAADHVVLFTNGGTAVISSGTYNLVRLVISPTANLTAHLTVNSGATLNLASSAAVPADIAIYLNPATGPAAGTGGSTLVNNGTITITGVNYTQAVNIQGNTDTHVVFTNAGTLISNITQTVAATPQFRIGNAATTSNVSNSGTMSITNTVTGQALNITAAAVNKAIPALNNSGTLNLTSSTSNLNVSGILNNTGIINMDIHIGGGTINNNTGGILNFKGTSAGANTSAIVAGAILNNLGGTINTNSGSLKGVQILSTTSSFSTGTPPSGTLSPGGLSGKGIMTLPTAATTLGSCELKVQVSASTTAGTDYDRIISATTSLTISNATLDVTGIYTPGGNTTIGIVLASGTGAVIVGNFASVIGLTSGWAVSYATAGRVNLVYTAPTATTPIWTGGGTSTDWTDANNWSPASVPDQNSDVTIGTGTYQPTIATNVNINSLTINMGATLTVTGPNLTVTGAIVNNGGTMTMASNSNLIQGGTTNSNTGNITVNRNSNALSRLDFTSWSSPVTADLTQFLTTFSPLTSTNRFYSYNQATNEYNEILLPGTISFAAGTGYLIRMPNTHPTSPTIWNGSFSGVPNNGTINKAITYSGAAFGYNMVGNPYPSTIDAQAFIAANTANIESSLYFWRKINGAAGSAYAVYNTLGSTAATASSALPNGTIQVGQGFFVKAKSASSVSFTNAMRVANNQNQFFKTKAAQKDRVWLNLSRPASTIVTPTGPKDIPEVFSQTLIGYTADATSGVDMYDAKYINDSETALTSSINSEEYSIQGRPAFDATDVVALNFKNDADVVYTIALDHFDGVFASGQDIYLLDSKTGIETDLKAGSYTFAATAGVDNSRFSLKYQKTLKVDAAAFDENSVQVYKNNGVLYVNSGKIAINSIQVYDMQGRLIAERKNVKSSTATLDNLKANNQVLLVKISGENNSVVSKKVLN